MKTPALIMLSALVALGHWLLLVPGPGLLAQVLAPGAPSDSASAMQLAQVPAPAAPVLILQTRRIESSSAYPPASVMQAVRTAPRSASTRPGIAKPSATVPAAAAPVQSEKPELGAAPTETVAERLAHTDADPGPDALVAASADAAVRDSSASPLSPPLAAQRIAHWQLPKPVRLNYEITGQSKGLGYRASGVLDWQQDGSRYDARMVASMFFLGNRTLSSQGEVTADGLAPTRFADKSRSEHAAHFQPDKGKITFSANTPDAPWQRGAQDRLSVFFQLTGMLAGQPERVAPGTRIPVYTAGARSADTWAFLVDDVQNLSLPAGNMPAIRLTRQSRGEYDQLVEVWFAPSLSYWPVRIKVTQANGDFVDQQLANVTPP